MSREGYYQASLLSKNAEMTTVKTRYRRKKAMLTRPSRINYLSLRKTWVVEAWEAALNLLKIEIIVIP